MASLPPFILSQLRAICGEQGVSQRENDRAAYSRDSSTSAMIEVRAGKIAHPPDVVAWPRNTEEVAQILKLAHAHRIPLVPYGAGSGVCGGAIPLRQGIVLDLKKLDRILAIDGESLTVRVQAGMMGEIFERELQKKGYTLGHFPSSIYTATVGGYLACRSAGQLSTKYGKIEDMVLGFTVCLANGKILEVGEDQFDLRELFVGSEGTLGVITETTLKMQPYPELQKFCGIRFPTVSKGLTAIRRFMQAGFKPAVVRLYDPLDTTVFLIPEKSASEPAAHTQIPSVLKYFFDLLKKQSFQLLLSQSSKLNWLIDVALSKSLLILGFEGAAWKAEAEYEEVLKICEAEGGENLGASPGLKWLKKRYNMGYKLSPLIDQGCFADTMEVAAPWNRIEELYEGIRAAIRTDALVMAHFSHVYPDGASIYFTFAGCAGGNEHNLKLHRKIWDKALEACLKHGGTISHHHGVGFLKAEAFKKELGPLMQFYQRAKGLLDPNGILNPGKMGL